MFFMVFSKQKWSCTNHEGERDGRRAGIVEKLLGIGTSFAFGASGKPSPLGCAVLSVVLGFSQVWNIGCCMLV